MTKDEALRLALEAMQFALHVGFDESSESQIKKGDKAWQQHQQAITAIKAALEAKDEPFGFFQYDIRLDAWVQNRINNKGVAFYIKEKNNE
jgi:hypothetical protein